MRYTVEYVNLVHNDYVTLNIGDIIAGIAIVRPTPMVVLRIDKTGRDF